MRAPGVLALAGAAALAATWLSLADARTKERVRTAAALTGGDPAQGPEAMVRYGCITCHEIPGVRGATGTVGPPLSGMSKRMYVGGVLRNTAPNLIDWILDPRAIDEKTAMPATGVDPEDARDIAGYLYTLE